MEKLYLLLQFVPVAAVIVWVGGVVALTLLHAQIARLADPAAPAAIGQRVGARWDAGALYCTSNPTTRTSRPLAEHPAATFTAIRKGSDLVVEGTATRTTDPSQLEAVAARYREGGWPAAVDGDAITASYRAPSADPPPWHLYRFVVAPVVGVTTEAPYDATRWAFTA